MPAPTTWPSPTHAAASVRTRRRRSGGFAGRRVGTRELPFPRDELLRAGGRRFAGARDVVDGRLVLLPGDRDCEPERLVPLELRDRGGEDARDAMSRRLRDHADAPLV